MTNDYGQAFPLIMGIINITPDSFFDASRCESEESILAKTEQMIHDGATILDIGACSTRPGSAPTSEDEEMKRMRFALKLIREKHPEVRLSVDTFRSNVARMAVKEFGVEIVNDVYGNDEKMFDTVADLGCTYVLTHPSEVDSTSSDDLIRKIFVFFAERIDILRNKGLQNILVDPGFGFGKTMEQNFKLLSLTKELKALGCPLLIGISRKRMVWQVLGITPQEALNGTSVLNTLALTQGANILRVHDVKEAKQCVDLFNMYNN